MPADKLALVDLLRVLAEGVRGGSEGGARLIADGDDLERIAVEDSPDVAAMKGWRYEMFGTFAEQLKQGQLALKADRGEVTLLTLGAPEDARKERVTG